MDDDHTSPAHVFKSGADYLDGVVADLEKQEQAMLAQAAATEFEQVRDGYVKFAAVLHHCADTLRHKSAELRAEHKA